MELSKLTCTIQRKLFSSKSKTPADLLKSLFAKPSSVVVVVVAAAWYQAEPIKLLAGTFVLYFNDPQHKLILALFMGGLCVCD